MEIWQNRKTGKGGTRMPLFDEITSRKNPRILLASSLSDKKRRDESGLFAFEGEKLLEEALSCDVALDAVYATEKAFACSLPLLEEAVSHGASLFRVTSEVYDKLTFEKAPQGVFTVAKKFALPELDGNAGGFVVLESVRDPGNVGAILRTSAALGCENVLLTKDCADVFHYKTLRAAMGAVFRTRLYVTADIGKSLALLAKHGAVYATALTESALPISQVAFSPEDSLVIGNEGHGVSDTVLQNCTEAVMIPMQGGSESLNASVAAALFIWEKQKSRISF